MARAAKEGLDGADIYSGCCTLKIEYAKVSFQVLHISRCFISLFFFQSARLHPSKIFLDREIQGTHPPSTCLAGSQKSIISLLKFFLHFYFYFHFPCCSSFHPGTLLKCWHSLPRCMGVWGGGSSGRDGGITTTHAHFAPWSRAILSLYLTPFTSVSVFFPPPAYLRWLPSRPQFTKPPPHV